MQRRRAHARNHCFGDFAGSGEANDFGPRTGAKVSDVEYRKSRRKMSLRRDDPDSSRSCPEISTEFGTSIIGGRRVITPEGRSR